MREILFRGKAKDGKWYFGDLVQFKSGLIYIQSKEEGKSNYVIPETVGQFTGLTDKNGKKIFEGDIVKLVAGKLIKIGAVFYGERAGRFGITASEEHSGANFSFMQQPILDEWQGEVIGNIHDNPELLGVTE